MIANVDLYFNYADLNRDLATWHWPHARPVPFTNDAHIENPALIIGCRKWIDSGLSRMGPDLQFLGFDFAMHVAVSDKYDIFIYT